MALNFVIQLKALNLILFFQHVNILKYLMNWNKQNLY